jgi:CrcB protein
MAPARRSPRPTRPDPRELAAVFVGGAAGALARIALGRLPVAGAPSWPWITMAINLGGAFAVGYFVTRLQERLPLSTYRRPFLGTGVCGGLTTFSTMQVELLKLLDAHRYGTAVAYAGVSLVGGFAAVHMASAFVRRVRALA